MNLSLDGFTKTHMKILGILADGEPHLREELEQCLSEPSRENLKPHLTAMRKLLRPQGQTILCVVRERRYHYCWTQLCPPALAHHQQSSEKISAFGSCKACHTTWLYQYSRTCPMCRLQQQEHASPSEPPVGP